MQEYFSQIMNVLNIHYDQDQYENISQKTANNIAEYLST